MKDIRITPRVTDRGSISFKANMPQLQTFEVANLGKGEITAAPADFLMVRINWGRKCYHFVNDPSSKVAFMEELVDYKKKLHLSKMIKDS